METLRASPDPFEQACELQRLGYRVVILRPRSKIPVFKGWQTKRYSETDLHAILDGTDCNIGLLCGGDLVVLDIDSTNVADLTWIIEHVGRRSSEMFVFRGGSAP